MSLKSLSDYTIYSRYAHYLPELKRRETWSEIVDRVFGMHERKYSEELKNKEFSDEFYFAKEAVRKKIVLGSQRALQFGGRWIEKENLKMFNCSFTHLDRTNAFSEIFYALLCGVGVGYSVQKQHIEKLPDIKLPKLGSKVYQIPDSIEGWADSLAVLMSSYFASDQKFSEYFGYNVEFDFSLIRKEGSLIAGQFMAPGPKGLKLGLEKIRTILDNYSATGTKLSPLACYDIICHTSDCVLSGGIRRAASLCLFSKDDDEMLKSKTGNWYITNPQRARSNNSVALKREDIKEEEFNNIFESIRNYGEPAFYFTSDLEVGPNPCVEISMYPKTVDGRSGLQGCNLVEINGKHCNNEEAFLEACRAAAVIGTIQAGYTKFNYLSQESKEIFEKEALLGVSLTGWMDNPEVLFDKDILKKGAELIKEINRKIAKLININPSARTTCVKPAGSTSCVLETSSGIHPHHSRKYIRNVQGNKNEFAIQLYKKINPTSVQESVWSANKTDEVISFNCEVPKGAILKNNINAIEFLEKIKFVQENWVINGRDSDLCLKNCNHNVSCTVTIKDNEWDKVKEFIFKNREFFTGISMLSSSGDLDYRQAPFTTVLTDKEIVEKYGNGSLMASGLIVDGIAAFDGDLFSACEAILGTTELPKLNKIENEPQKPSRRKFKTEKDYSSALINYSIELNLFFQAKGDYTSLSLKHDWVRRAKQFSERYFNNDIKLMTYCLKHVDIWKKYLDIKRDHKEIDWSTVVEEKIELIAADSLASAACAGGACSL